MRQVKDLALSLQWLGSLLWHGFDPWLENFQMLWGSQNNNNNNTVCMWSRGKRGKGNQYFLSSCWVPGGAGGFPWSHFMGRVPFSK